MTWEFKWQNAIYDTQRWEYVHTNGHSFTRKGEVNRIIRARQSPNDRLYEYNAWAFSQKLNRRFDTKDEAVAWVTACERMN